MTNTIRIQRLFALNQTSCISRFAQSKGGVITPPLQEFYTNPQWSAYLGWSRLLPGNIEQPFNVTPHRVPKIDADKHADALSGFGYDASA